MKPLLYIVYIAASLVTSQAMASTIWTQGTAEILPQGKYETGIFSPLRYGYQKDLELSTYALGNILLPNISVKKRWLSNRSSALATEHSLSYPSLFLRTFSKEGIGGLLPKTTQVPELLTITNQIYYTLKLSPNLWITPQFAIETTLNASKDAMPTIDFALIYQSTASYYTGSSFRLGVDVDGAINSSWRYSLDLDYYYLGDLQGNTALQHKGLVQYSFSQGLSLMVGYKYVQGEYPFGFDERFFPFADVLWRW